MQLFESIRWEGGRFHLLEYHSERVHRARSALFGARDRWDLEQMLHSESDLLLRLRQIPPPYPAHKLRFVYQANSWTTELSLYQTRRIETIKPIRVRTFDYGHKYTDRHKLDAAFARRGAADDVLICFGDKVKDTSYCNVVFAEGAKLFTPAEPLLRGVQREMLIASGEIEPIDILIKDLHYFDQMHLINAMLPLGKMEARLQ